MKVMAKLLMNIYLQVASIRAEVNLSLQLFLSTRSVECSPYFASLGTVERNALKCGRTTCLTNAGLRERHQRERDARQIPTSNAHLLTIASAKAHRHRPETLG